jgi:hypothetical protein
MMEEVGEEGDEKFLWQMVLETARNADFEERRFGYLPYLPDPPDSFFAQERKKCEKIRAAGVPYKLPFNEYHGKKFCEISFKFAFPGYYPGKCQVGELIVYLHDRHVMIRGNDLDDGLSGFALGFLFDPRSLRVKTSMIEARTDYGWKVLFKEGDAMFDCMICAIDLAISGKRNEVLNNELDYVPGYSAEGETTISWFIARKIRELDRTALSTEPTVEECSRRVLEWPSLETHLRNILSGKMKRSNEALLEFFGMTSFQRKNASERSSRGSSDSSEGGDKEPVFRPGYLTPVNWGRIDNLLREYKVSGDVLHAVSECKKQSFVSLYLNEAPDWEYGGLMSDPEIVEYMKSVDFHKVQAEKRQNSPEDSD